MTEAELKEVYEKAKARLANRPPLDRAISALETKRSMIRGLARFDAPIEEINKRISAEPEFVVLAEIKRLQAHLASIDAAHTAKIAELEAERDRLREALESLTHAIMESLDGDFGFWSAPSSEHVRRQFYPAYKEARAALNTGGGG